MRKILTGQLKAAISLVLLMLAGLAAGSYIVAHQRINPPAWVPIVGKPEFILKAQLTSVQGVLPGQGQAVQISGVRVGQIGGIELVDGAAIATLRIEKRYGHIYPNASVLLRPKTALKDMVAEVDPGTPDAGRALASGALLRTDRTASDINLDEVLASLDQDSRDYLTLLVTDGGDALNGNRGQDLAQVFRRFEPLSRHVAEATRLVARRRARLKRLVGNLSQLSTELGARDKELATFVRSSAAVFRRFAAQTDNLQRTVALLPSTLDAGNTALAKVDTLSRTLRSASTNLDPAARALAPALREVGPFFDATTAPIRDSIRPLTREARPTTRALIPATGRLAEATPELTELTGVLNSLVNELAYDAGGKNAGSKSFLFYVPWASHNTNSVMAGQDGIGPLRRSLVLVSCTSLGLLDTLAAPTRNPTLATLIQLLGIPKTEAVCGSKK
jgi:phospholipid/cholesterol/gamma-HCH transport system substrate-binding protein